MLDSRKTKTVSLYITALKSKHINFDISTKVFDDPRIKHMLQGSLHLFDAGPIREKGEITRPLFFAMVKTRNLNFHDDINIIAVFTVAFAAFL